MRGIRYGKPWRPNARLTEADVRSIRERPDVSIADLAAEFWVGLNTIRDIRNGKTWKEVIAMSKPG